MRKSSATIISSLVLHIMQLVEHCGKTWLQEPIPATLCHLPGSLGNPLKNSSAMPVAHRNTKSCLATMLANVHNLDCLQKQADATHVYMLYIYVTSSRFVRDGAMVYVFHAEGFTHDCEYLRKSYNLACGFKC